MKKLITILLLSLVTVFTACAPKIPLSESQQSYIGTWMKADGTWLRISANGRGDFEMSNSNVSGGAVTITEEKITIEILGKKSNWRIDKPPFQEDGYWLMDLTGNIYEKQ